MVAPISPIVEAAIDAAAPTSGIEPYWNLLNDCMPFLSTQDLALIADDIHAYVNLPDEDVEETDLFSRYPEARFVLSSFRQTFRSLVMENPSVQPNGQLFNQENRTLYVHNIMHIFNRSLYRRLACYTAGLDVDLITALSATNYESQSPEGQTIAILPSLKWIKKDFTAVFDPLDSVPFEQIQLRSLRKQLNICGSGALAVYKDDCTGIYKTVGLIPQETAMKLPRFHFQKHAEWIFAVATPEGNGQRLRYSNGNLQLPLLNLRDVYQRKIEHLNIDAEARRRFSEIFNVARKCKHGAILIVAEETLIQEELNRLVTRKRGTRLNPPVSLTPENASVLEQFSAVDGAVFLDFQGNCHAFGVILDGIVQSEGNNARGSRYNSTKTYTEWIRGNKKYNGAGILGVVKSEDGMMDIFDKA